MPCYNQIFFYMANSKPLHFLSISFFTLKNVNPSYKTRNDCLSTCTQRGIYPLEIVTTSIWTCPESLPNICGGPRRLLSRPFPREALASHGFFTKKDVDIWVGGCLTMYKSRVIMFIMRINID